MKSHELRPPTGAHRPRKRVGRGDGSGNGSYSGRGNKGQKARSGGGVRPGFEGGQLSITKSLPKMRGFTNVFRKQCTVVNLNSLANFPAGSEITPKQLVDHGVIKNLKTPIKILGLGNIEVPLTIEAHQFSKSARNKIEAAGGTLKEIE